MLALTRRPKEALILETTDGPIRIVFDIVGGQIKVAIDAPDNVDIVREELIQGR
jgi:carbon storage regulator CsrA